MLQDSLRPTCTCIHVQLSEVSTCVFIFILESITLFDIYFLFHNAYS